MAQFPKAEADVSGLTMSMMAGYCVIIWGIWPLYGRQKRSD